MSEWKLRGYRKDLRQRNKKVAENEEDHGRDGRIVKKTDLRKAEEEEKWRKSQQQGAMGKKVTKVAVRRGDEWPASPLQKGIKRKSKIVEDRYEKTYISCLWWACRRGHSMRCM